MLSRRNFLSVLSLGTFGLGLGYLGLDEELPSVLLILVDSLNAWGNTFGGHPDAVTPHIDQLAKRSIVFTNAHSAGTNSNASRTSLFTGLYPTSTGIYIGDANYRDVLPTHVTIPQYFLQSRYQVSGAGRLFHQPDKYSWRDWKYFDYENHFVSEHLVDLPSGPNFDWGPIDIDEEQMHDYQVAQWAIDKIETLPRPFFLAVGLNTTRHPWYLPSNKFHRINPSVVSLPSERTGTLPLAASDIIRNNHKHDLVLEADQWRQALAAYLSSIAFVDEQIGRVVRALDESDVRDNTVIILASTHGLHLGDKRFWLFDTLWEQVTRVPLLIALPPTRFSQEHVQNSRIGHSVSLVDIFPTLIDIWDHPIEQSFDGQSLLPLILDSDMSWERPVLTALSDQDFAVRTNRWRYIHYHDGGEELYEYIGDPSELRNLANDPAHQDTIQQLRQYLPENPLPART